VAGRFWPCAGGIGCREWFAVRRRVLVEHADWRLGVMTAWALHEAGYAVATCPGPQPDDLCPLLRGRECPLAERADVILSSIGTLPEGKSIAACLRARLPRTPLLLDVEPHEAAQAVRAALGH
jgi:hypothetical protein